MKTETVRAVASPSQTVVHPRPCHTQIVPVSRARGDFATAKLAYITGCPVQNQLAGVVHGSYRNDVYAWETCVPVDELPMSAVVLWNQAESRERRTNSLLARMIHFAFPKELTPEVCVQLLKQAARWFVDRFGVAATFAVHFNPEKAQPADGHLLLSTRQLIAGTFTKKVLELDGHKGRKAYREFREFHAGNVNEALVSMGSETRVDHRSFEKQGRKELPMKNERRGPKGDEDRRTNEYRRKLNSELRRCQRRLQRYENALKRINAALKAEAEKAIESAKVGRIDQQLMSVYLAPYLWAGTPADTAVQAIASQIRLQSLGYATQRMLDHPGCSADINRVAENMASTAVVSPADQPTDKVTSFLANAIDASPIRDAGSVPSELRSEIGVVRNARQPSIAANNGPHRESHVRAYRNLDEDIGSDPEDIDPERALLSDLEAAQRPSRCCVEDLEQYDEDFDLNAERDY